MNKFQPYINVAYPSGNKPIFEEWFADNYRGCNTDRELLPVFFTSYWVNHSYAQDLQAKKELQDYIDGLDRNKKWFVPIQYDDAAVIDFKDLDVIQFNMSKSYDVPLPLLCQPHPYRFTGGKKWFASFVGSRTHPIRDSLDRLKGQEGYFISFEYGEIEKYCRVLHDSMFSLCPRGYGLASFRLAESVQYGAIPVYLSDEFIIPSWVNFEEFGVLIKSEDAHRIDEILQDIPIEKVVEMQSKLPEAYENFYSYEANLKHIINYLETEYNLRKQVGTDAPINEGT